ncbi:MAG: radical SAM protein [Candidatus Omnitrophota bacterium]|nr:radical SAM protein [Candidatus Omnitrophota bacterium]MDZ4242699.1 radical SAM protein [Candidatus Omnitrophota bacterium]
MRVAILNPSFGENFVRVARWAAKSRGRVQRHPDYLLTAAQVLIDAGHDVIYVEAAARNFTPEQSYEIVEAFRPDLLVIHATTPSIYNDIDQAKVIKERTGCKVAFVGQHVTAEPDNTLDLGRNGVDYILRSEYDYTLRDLAAGMEPANILGMTWWDGQKNIHNPNRPAINAQELPFPAWQLIEPEWYPDGGKKFPFLTLITGRGCNNACTFCRDPQLMYGYNLRNRTATQVVDEMEHDLKLHPQIREIMFETDTFAADRKHVTDVCNEIIARGINQKITWSCNMRVNTELELLPLMRKAGCRMLMTGFEFGYDDGLRAVRKGGVNVNMAREYAFRAHDLGFTIHGCFMIGAPGETRDTARQTIDFAKSLPLDTVQITGVAAYPGTSIYKWAKEKKFILANDWKEWLTAEKEQRTLLNYPQLSSNEIDQFIDTGLKEFYLRPKQMWQMLISIRSIGDLLRKLHGFKAFVDYFFKKFTGILRRAETPRLPEAAPHSTCGSCGCH